MVMEAHNSEKQKRFFLKPKVEEADKRERRK